MMMMMKQRKGYIVEKCTSMILKLEEWYRKKVTKKIAAHFSMGPWFMVDVLVMESP